MRREAWELQASDGGEISAFQQRYFQHVLFHQININK